TDVEWAPLHREVARNLHVSRLGNTIGAEHAAALQASNRGHNNDCATAVFRHAWQHQLAQTVGTANVGVHDLVEGFIRNILGRTIKRVQCRIDHQNIDPAVMGNSTIHQSLELLLVVDVTCQRQRFTAFGTDVCDYFITGILIAAGYHNLRALLCHTTGDSQSYAFGRPGNQGYFAAQIKQTHSAPPILPSRHHRPKTEAL